MPYEPVWQTISPGAGNLPCTLHFKQCRVGAWHVFSKSLKAEISQIQTKLLMKKTHLGKYFKQYLDKGFYLSYVVIKADSLHYRISAQAHAVLVIDNCGERCIFSLKFCVFPTK